jgi:general secretion pathway protein G
MNIRTTAGPAGEPKEADFYTRARAGYSLLEILIVLTIIGLIATFVGPRLLSQLDRSKVTAARVQVKALSSAIETMHLDLGRYPTEAEGLDLLSRPPEEGGSNWAGPYLENGVPLDPWRNPYGYRFNLDAGDRPVVLSFGADGKDGGSGTAADILSNGAS